MDDSSQLAGPERRRAKREGAADRNVRCRAELRDGVILERMVEDISVGGARISGPTSELSMGDEIILVFVFLSGEEVAYRGIVRHIDADGRFFGVQFASAPRPIKIIEPGLVS